MKKTFAHEDRIAIKLHMGEPGNVYFIRPSFTGRVASILSEIGCRPFIFDTPVVYRSPRNSEKGYLKSAAEHGYTESETGAPILISDRNIAVKGNHMTYKTAADPAEADGVLLLSHVKGHLASGFGGAIKNIGMGCVAKETKGAIHAGGEPFYTEGCTQCNACVENCPTQNIRIDEERPWFDCTWCPGCSNCVLVCPEKCIQPRVATFDDLLSEAAVLAYKNFKKFYAVNVLINITRLCDCVADAGPIIVKDLGFICGDDMLSVDIASLEVIKEASGKEDIFCEYSKRSPWGHLKSTAELMKRKLEVSIRDIG